MPGPRAGSGVVRARPPGGASRLICGQRTLARTARTEGVGLHSGARVRVALVPAPANSGIVFVRTDLCPAREVPARVVHVADTRYSTSLECGGARIATVEHLLAALAGMGIDNLRIELSGAEVPIMDGSAEPFVQLIREAGIREQPAPRLCLRVRETVSVVDGDKRASLAPCDGFSIAFTIDFDHPVFRDRAASAVFDPALLSFEDGLSRARTFGFMHEVEYLRSRGLARGGSTENAIVVDDYRILNEDGLRFEDEFVQHKILDALGDLYLLGAPLQGAYQAHKSGHTLNLALLQALLARPGAWEMLPQPTPDPMDASPVPGP